MHLGILMSTDMLVGVLAEPGRRGPRIVHSAAASIPAGADAAAVAAATRRLRSLLGARDRWAWACLDDREAPLRSVEMPRMRPREIARTISLDLERYLPFRHEQAYVDFAVVGAGGDPDRQRVAVAGTPRGWVDTLVAGTKAAGLELRRLEVEAICLERSLRAAGLQGRAYGVVGLEPEQARLVLFRDRQPVLTRRMPVDPHLPQEVVRSVQFFLVQDRDAGFEALHVVAERPGSLIDELGAELSSRIEGEIPVHALTLPFASTPVGLREAAALGCLLGKRGLR